MAFQDVIDTVGWLSPAGMAVKVAQGGQPENMEALNKYMLSTPIKTAKARKLQDDWGSWFHNLSWYETTMENDILLEALNKKREFDLANTENSMERKKVEEVYKDGARVVKEIAATTGETTAIQSDGSYNVPLFSKTSLHFAIGGLIAGLGLLAGYKVGRLI
jgi:hypothetical protein